MSHIIALAATAASPSPSASQEPSPGIGLPTQREFTGPWLSQQLALTLSLGILSLLSFSILVKRNGWRDYLAPIGRPEVLTGEDEDEDEEEEIGSAARITSRGEKGDHTLNDGKKTRMGRALSAMGLEWLATTLYTSDIAAAHLSGPPTSSIDTLTLLDFFRFGTKLFAMLSVWSLLVVGPVNLRENGWLDGVSPNDEKRQKEPEQGKASAFVTQVTSQLLFMKKKHPGEDDPSRQPLPITPGSPNNPDLKGTTLYDTTHLVTLYVFTLGFLWLITRQTSQYLANRQKILHSLHTTLASRSVLIRDLPVSLRTPEALQEYFRSSLEMSADKAWVLPDVGMGVRKLLKQREAALRDLETAWVNWVGNPVKKEFRAGWKPSAIESRMKARSERILAGQEALPARGWIVTEGHRDQEGSIRLPADGQGNQSLTSDSRVCDQVPPLDTDPSWGPPSHAHNRPTRRLHMFSFTKIDLLADLEVKFLALDVALCKIRQGMTEGRWKYIGVGFVEFKEVKDALIASQTLYHSDAGSCRTVMAPDSRDLLWRNIGLPMNEKRLRQFLISFAVTLLYLFYIPPLLFLGSLLSPGFLNQYIPGLYKLLSSSPRLEALISTSLPSLVLVGFNAGLPILLESTTIWQGIKTKSEIEINVLKKYHIFLITSVIFIFFITGTAFGVLLDLSANPMAILDKLSLSLPGARNFSLSYVILQSFTILPFQLLSIATIFLNPVYTVLAKTPREHAEAHPTIIFKPGTAYPQALIIATLGVVYAIVKPLITIFAMLYFAIGYVVYKYKLLFVFYPPPTSMQNSLTAVLRPRLIFAIFLFQVFQLSLFSAHRQVLLILLTLPLMAVTLWYARVLDKRFSSLEKYEALQGAIQADREQQQRATLATPPAPPSAAARQEGPSTKSRPEASFAPGDVHHDDEDNSDDEATGPWQKQPHFHAGGWHDSSLLHTGTSTPSEYEPSPSATPTPQARSANRKASGSGSGSIPSSQNRIWAPFARLKRNRSSRRGRLHDDDNDRQEGNARASQPRMIYHRPSSRFTNYRETTSEGSGGIEGLPGIVEPQSYDSSTRLSISPSLPSGRRRGESLSSRSARTVAAGIASHKPTRPTLGVEGLLSSSHHGRSRSYSASRGGVSQTTAEQQQGGDETPVSLVNVDDAANDEEQEESSDEADEVDAEQEHIVENYEHPAIKGQLKQIWLPV
ncbi:unnamed protein product [Sympodiomycopsis kandeliae]